MAENSKLIDGYSLTHKMRKIRREYPLTSTEQALYYELIAICNEGDWSEVFSVSCAELCNTLQVTTNSLVKARMALINASLISYKSGKSRRQFSSYSFSSVSKFDIDKGTDKGTDKGRDKGIDVSKSLITIINNTETKTKTKSMGTVEQVHTPEQIIFFKNFNDWITTNSPRVHQFKQPFTISEFLKIKKEFTHETITKILSQFQNRADVLKKNISANLTFRNWEKREFKTDPKIDSTGPSLAEIKSQRILNEVG